jgi:hypothetical protein
MTDDDDKGKGGSGKGNNDDGKGGHPGRCGNHVTARAREVRVTMIMKKTVTHFVSLSLHRFTVLYSGKGDNNNKKEKVQRREAVKQ